MLAATFSANSKDFTYLYVGITFSVDISTITLHTYYKRIYAYVIGRYSDRVLDATIAQPLLHSWWGSDKNRL